MSSKIVLDNVTFKKNPSLFKSPLEMDITFTALSPLPGVIEWKIIYVGSAKSQQYDQVLEEFQIGPIEQESTMKFSVECAAPNFRKIPREQLICITAIIITVSYKGQQFIRIGYYVHNVVQQSLPEQQRSNASAEVLINNTRRTILADKPRITKFRIDWGEGMEDTNRSKIKQQSPEQNRYKKYDSNNKCQIQSNEQKQSTNEQKQIQSRSLMKQQNQKNASNLHMSIQQFST